MIMKRGQSATEYMLTYGWVLIAIFVAIGALMYFNVLDFNRFTLDRCELIPGMDCINHRVASDQIDLVIRNGLGYDISSLNVTIQSEEGCGNVMVSASSGLNDGEDEKLTFNCTSTISAGAGSNYKANLKIMYIGTSGSLHTSYGKLEAQIEQ